MWRQLRSFSENNISQFNAACKIKYMGQHGALVKLLYENDDSGAGWMYANLTAINTPRLGQPNG